MKVNLLKIVITWSPGYFIVLMLTLIALTLYVLLMFQFLLTAISVVLQSIFLIKTSILVFVIAADCFMMSGNIKKLTCWHPKVVEILTI